MYTIFGFYKFKQLKKISKLKDKLQNFIDNYKIKGTIIISPEGINGSISFLKKNTKQIKINLKKIFSISKFDNENISFNKFIPFHKGRVKVKKEVVPIGKRLKKKVKDNHLSPKEWNNFVLKKDTYIIDTRKDFEFRIGTFKRSINPKLNNFRDFSKYFKKFNKDSKIGMFCTGGIRCEKSTSYLKSMGFKDVSHLEGGILKYLEKIPEKHSKWNGSCFVFDYRVSVDHNLEIGQYEMCFACRMPISQNDKMHKYFVQGESCHHCFKSSNDKQKKRVGKK